MGEQGFLAGGGIRALGFGPIDSVGQNLVIPFPHGALRALGARLGNPEAELRLRRSGG